MNQKSLYPLAALSLLVTTVEANESSKFSGEISINGGFSSNNSKLDTNSSETVSDLSKGEHKTTGFVAPLGSLYYSLNELHTQRLYLGTSRDDLAVGLVAFEIGYQFTHSNGTTVDLGYLPTVVSDEVWANPYLTGKNRDKTDRSGNAYRLKLSNLMNSSISMQVAYATSEIKNEKITVPELLRDSDTYFIKAQMRGLSSSHSGFTPAIKYKRHISDGKAASYHSYAGELTYFYLGQKHSFFINGGIALRDFDASNPIFGKHRVDNEYSASFSYEYKNIPRWENWSIVSFVGYKYNSSNIDFHENDILTFSLGTNYSF